MPAAAAIRLRDSTSPGPQRREVDVDEYAVAFDDAAGDESRVDQAGMAGRDDRADRIASEPFLTLGLGHHPFADLRVEFPACVDI
jgi:hypothetical protein